MRRRSFRVMWSRGRVVGMRCRRWRSWRRVKAECLAAAAAAVGHWYRRLDSSADCRWSTVARRIRRMRADTACPTRCHLHCPLKTDITRTAGPQLGPWKHFKKFHFFRTWKVNENHIRSWKFENLTEEGLETNLLREFQFCKIVTIAIWLVVIWCENCFRRMISSHRPYTVLNW